MTFQENLVPNFPSKGEQGREHAPPPPRKVHLWHIFFAVPAMNINNIFIFIHYYHKIKVIVFFKRKKFFLIEMNCKWSFHWIVFLISEFDCQ